MGQAIAPRSLRSVATVNLVNETFENYSGRKVSAVAGLIAVASFSGAEAQQSNLPPVTVDAPVERPRPAAAKPTPDQIRARNALRRAARRTQPAQVAAVPFPNAGGLQADRNPYADAAAPYKVDHVQASGKFPEPLLNTPKTVTVLSKEVLEDKNATTLKQAILSTAGVTLGTGEGGNAFGDRFFIRGFDARNDVFLDGVRDAGVSVRENFFTEQVEILRGPGSSLCRPRHHRRRHQHRHQAGDGGKELLQHGHHVRHRPHQARHARRQSGDQSDIGGARGRPVPGRRRGRPRLTSRTIAMAGSSRRRGSRSTRSRSPRATFTPSCTGIAGFRRAVLPAEHGLHRRRPVPGFRRQPQQFLRLRQSRLLQGRAGHRHHQWRSPDHARSDPERQGQGFALDAELYRHAFAEIAGARHPAFGLDAERQSAEPLSDHRRRRQPDRSNLQVRHRRLEAHGTWRRRDLA